MKKMSFPGPKVSAEWSFPCNFLDLKGHLSRWTPITFYLPVIHKVPSPLVTTCWKISHLGQLEWNRRCWLMVPTVCLLPHSLEEKVTIWLQRQSAWKPPPPPSLWLPCSPTHLRWKDIPVCRVYPIHKCLHWGNFLCPPYVLLHGVIFFFFGQFLITYI